jgi:hypothetical protein
MGFFSSLFSRKTEPVKTPGAKVVSHSVVGTSYRQKEILAMGRINPDYALDKRGLLKRWPKGVTVYEYTFNPKKAELVPEPENPEDPKAIKVLVDGVHVGYIKAGSCAHLHKLIRENRIQAIVPKIIGGKYKELYSHDADPKSSADFELDKGSSPFGVRLEIAELPAPEKGKH